MTRMLQEVDGPLGEGLPVGGVLRDARLVQVALGLEELLRHLLLVDSILPLDLDVWFEQLHNFWSTS